MKKLLLLSLILLVLPVVFASIDETDIRFIGKQSKILDLKETCFNNNTFCSGAATCNITIFKPNQDLLINGQLMTNQGTFHNYTLNTTNTVDLGIYETNVVCDDNSIFGFDTFYFLITFHGKEEPSDFTKVIFILGFIIILAAMLLSLLNLVNHLFEWDIDAKDMMFMWLVYFSVLAMKYFNLEYMGSQLIDNFSDVFLRWGRWTNIILPLIFFVFSYFKSKAKEQKRQLY